LVTIARIFIAFLVALMRGATGCTLGLYLLLLFDFPPARSPDARDRAER
jgi:hypothetical protein